MADFSEAVKIVLKHEGGWSDDPVDSGGKTMRGITFRLFIQYAKRLGVKPTVEALRGLTVDQAEQIYYEEFWTPMRGNEFKSQKLANVVLSAYVNLGNPALKILQRVLDVDDDGVIGPYTLKALNTADQEDVYIFYKLQWLWYYKKLVDRRPAYSKFYKGWENRVNYFKADDKNNIA